MIEIRWHGRGGLGVKSASTMLANIMFNHGKHVQGFPEYGPERKGAPVKAYNRISDKKVLVHENVYSPDYVVCLDPLLIDSNILSGIKENGTVIVNSNKSKEEVCKMLGLECPVTHIKVIPFDAHDLSTKTIGHAIPNVCLMTILLKELGMDEDDIVKHSHNEFKQLFSSKNKQGYIDKNLECIKQTLKNI